MKNKVLSVMIPDLLITSMSVQTYANTIEADTANTLYAVSIYESEHISICKEPVHVNEIQKLYIILIPKTLIDKIASRNFVRQGEHRKTGFRLSRMFNAA